MDASRDEILNHNQTKGANMDKLTNNAGETWDQWADMFFEFSYCDECHADKDEHVGVIVMGNWFAVCQTVPA